MEKHAERPMGLRRNPLSLVLSYLFLTVTALFALAPIFWSLTCSLRENNEILKYVVPLSVKTIVPQKPTAVAYLNIFTRGSFSQAVMNTIIICAITVGAGLALNALAGYALSKFRFRLRNACFLFVILTIMIPFEGISIPLYGIVQSMGLTNTLWALLLPMIGNGMVIFLCKQFFEEIPDSLTESATIDGCGILGCFFRIILPLSKPVMISAGLTLFTSQWEAFMWPLLAGRADNLKMVQVALTQFKLEHYTVWNELYAASIVTALIPLLLLVPFQRYFIQGIASTGIKE